MKTIRTTKHIDCEEETCGNCVFLEVDTYKFKVWCALFKEPGVPYPEPEQIPKGNITAAKFLRLPECRRCGAI